jgi:hypothetical protein
LNPEAFPGITVDELLETTNQDWKQQCSVTFCRQKEMISKFFSIEKTTENLVDIEYKGRKWKFERIDVITTIFLTFSG